MAQTCPKCGTEYFIESKFCEQCGYNVAPEFTESPVCPTCNTTYPANTWFCAKDGSRLVRPGLHGSSDNPQLFQFYDQGYPKSSSGSRFVAALLDGLLTVGMAIPAFFLFFWGLGVSESYRSSERSMAPMLFLLAVVFYLVPLGYNFIKDGLGKGQSFGKRAVDLMVVNLDNNTPCSTGKSFVRNLISTLVSAIPFIGWLIEPVMVLATDDGRKLGDKAANTQVIDKKYFNQ